MIGLPDDCLNHESTFCKPTRGEEVCVLPSDVKNIDGGLFCPQLSQGRSEAVGRLLIVEGNIGIGKTTLARKLAKELNYQLFLEPTVENPFLGACAFESRVASQVGSRV